MTYTIKTNVYTAETFCYICIYIYIYIYLFWIDIFTDRINIATSKTFMFDSLRA